MINEKQFGLEHRRTVSSLQTLAMFYEVQDRHDEAKALYKRAFRICERLLGLGHPETQKMLVCYAELAFQNEMDEVDSPNMSQKITEPKRNLGDEKGENVRKV